MLPGALLLKVSCGASSLISMLTQPLQMNSDQHVVTFILKSSLISLFVLRLMFEASGFLVSSAALLVGVTLVLRVDVAVSRWFKRLVPDASR